MSKTKTAKPAAKKTTVKKTTTKAKAKVTDTKTSKARKSNAKSKSTAKAKPPADQLESLNETGRRRNSVEPVVERRQRRRQIDPTTCEREYSNPEIEFMQAMDDYKRQSGRMFPTCSEILEVISRLGYQQVNDAAELMYDPSQEVAESASDELDSEE